jgi:hypothetical protein
VDAPDVADVVQRVRVQYHQISRFVRRDRANGVLQTKVARCVPGRRLQLAHRRQTRPHQQLEFVIKTETWEAVGVCRIASGDEPDADAFQRPDDPQRRFETCAATGSSRSRFDPLVRDPGAQDPTIGKIKLIGHVM